MSDQGLRGRVAVVSGATSGIGAEVARRLAAAGAAVVVSGRAPERAAAVVDEIIGGGERATASLGDIADSATAAAVVDHAVATYGRLDIVVNAAGVITRSTAEHTSDDEWHRVMRANVDGVFFFSRAAIPALRAQGGGSIVNLSSTCGLVGSPGVAAYCASKGAVSNLTRAMALDHAAEGIRINAVCPGAVDTPMLYSEHGPAIDAETVRTGNLASIPQGRMATVGDIADLVLFLASDRSSHIVGANVSVDGGYTAQ